MIKQRILRTILVAGITFGCITTASAAALEEAQALLEQGRNDKALKVVENHLRENPEDAEARFLRGITLVKLNRNNDAIEVFAALTRDYPQLPEPYNNLAVLYAQQGEYEKARDALEAALATHPSYATAHENLGDIYAALASVAYNRALTLDKGNDQLRVKLNLMNQLSASPQVAATGGATATPATSPAVVAQPASDEVADAVRAAVYGWSRAWSKQDVDAYLASYSASFRPESGDSRRRWSRVRRDRLTKPKFIEVKVGAPDVRISGDRAVATFEQRYTSDTYSDVVRKVLELKNESDGWKIVRERSTP